MVIFIAIVPKICYNKTKMEFHEGEKADEGDVGKYRNYSRKKCIWSTADSRITKEEAAKLLKKSISLWNPFF